MVYYYHFLRKLHFWTHFIEIWKKINFWISKKLDFWTFYIKFASNAQKWRILLSSFCDNLFFECISLKYDKIRVFYIHEIRFLDIQWFFNFLPQIYFKLTKITYFACYYIFLWKLHFWTLKYDKISFWISKKSANFQLFTSNLLQINKKYVFCILL